MSNTAEHNWSLETFHYEPNKTLPMIAGLVIGIILHVIAYRIWRSKTFWGWPAPTAPGLLALGYALRSIAPKKPHILWLHVANNVMIVVPVAGFLIFNYLVWSKILQRFSTSRGRYSLVKPEVAFKILIACDIINFTAQGAGAGMRATVDNQNTGRIIFLVGIITQNLTYGLFVGLLVFSHRAFLRDIKFDNDNFPFRLFYVLYVSSLFIMVRTGYRFMELIQGNDGNFVTHEKWLYLFDLLPLTIANGIFAIFWPGSMIEKAAASTDYGSIRMQSRDVLTA